MGRIGGEEFLCVLPRIDIKKSQLIAERMITNISKQAVKNTEGQDVFITVSIGITELSSELIDGKSLYAYADKALYQAKEAGKNRAVVYSASR